MCLFTCSSGHKIPTPKYQRSGRNATSFSMRPPHSSNLFQDPKFTFEPSCSTSEGFLFGSETNVKAIFVEINFAPDCTQGKTKLNFLMNLEPILPHVTLSCGNSRSKAAKASLSRPPLAVTPVFCVVWKFDRTHRIRHS